MTIVRILTACRTCFVESGHAGLSLRQVADASGMAVGNLTYHFPTKEALLHAMLLEARADFVDSHIESIENSAHPPLELLLDIVEFHVRDGRDSFRFFYQLWGFAASSEKARLTVRDLYLPVGRAMRQLVRLSNPNLNDTQVALVVLQIFSLGEGYKLFLGMGPIEAPPLQTAERDVRILARQIVLNGTA